MTNNLAAALEGLERLITTSSRDWGTYRVDAWLYAVLVGWDCEETEHDETCVHGGLEEMAARHGWDDEAVAKARRYRAAVRAAVSAAVAPPADRAAVLREAADAVFALEYDVMVGEEGDENLGSMREAWDVGTIHATQLLRRMADETQPIQPDTAPPAPATEPWRGATDLATDPEIAARAATGLVGYRQGRGTLLHCLAHKPAPASRWADFHEITADDLDAGGICVHPRCGRDLLAPWPTTGARQDGAQP